MTLNILWNIMFWPKLMAKKETDRKTCMTEVSECKLFLGTVYDFEGRLNRTSEVILLKLLTWELTEYLWTVKSDIKIHNLLAGFQIMETPIKQDSEPFYPTTTPTITTHNCSCDILRQAWPDLASCEPRP